MRQRYVCLKINRTFDPRKCQLFVGRWVFYFIEIDTRCYSAEMAAKYRRLSKSYFAQTRNAEWPKKFRSLWVSPDSVLTCLSPCQREPVASSCVILHPLSMHSVVVCKAEGATVPCTRRSTKRPQKEWHVKNSPCSAKMHNGIIQTFGHWCTKQTKSAAQSFHRRTMEAALPGMCTRNCWSDFM